VHERGPERRREGDPHASRGGSERSARLPHGGRTGRKKVHRTTPGPRLSRYTYTSTTSGFDKSHSGILGKSHGTLVAESPTILCMNVNLYFLFFGR
jgi:hypothetical protein